MNNRKRTKKLRKQNSIGKIRHDNRLNGSSKDVKLREPEKVPKPQVVLTNAKRTLNRSQSVDHNIGSSPHQYEVFPPNPTRRLRCSHSVSDENLWLIGDLDSFHVQVTRRGGEGNWRDGGRAYFSYSVDNLN